MFTCEKERNSREEMTIRTGDLLLDSTKRQA